MTNILVSTYDKGKYTSESVGLYKIDIETKEVEKVGEPFSAMGIAKFKDGFVIGDAWDGIKILDNNFNITKDIPYAGRQVHDVVIHDNLIYVVESMNNRINKFDFDGNFVGDIRLFDSYRMDTHHINSLKYHDGYFYLSMFSLSGHLIDSEEKQYDGGIIKFKEDSQSIEVIEERLYMPHSIHFIGDDLYFADSKRNLIVKHPYEEILGTSGDVLTRGIAHKDHLLFIGESIDYTAKFNRRKTGSILIHDMKTGKRERIDIPHNFIYDIVVLD